MRSLAALASIVLLAGSFVPALAGTAGPTYFLGPFSGEPADVLRLASAWALGAPLPAAVPPARPFDLFDAAARLMERHGGIQPDALAALAGVPAALRPDVARVMIDFLAFEDAAIGLAEEAAFLDVLVARQVLFGSTLALGERVASLPRVPVSIDASPAFTLDLSDADSVYAQDAALQIDVGGNDVYTNRAGGGVAGTGDFHELGLLHWCDARDIPLFLPAGFVADFGGDDRYVSGMRCGVNGGGMGGAGFLYDAAGNDVYESGQGGVNGGAFLGGVGFLYDAGGDDVYHAQITHDTYAYGANGAASFGAYGLLVDVSGHDIYIAGQEGANGGAYGGGVGALLDGSGNDRYSATALGVNGAALLGRGLLWDGAGDDSYAAIGCCAWGDPDGTIYVALDNGGGDQGFGCLYDGDGTDRYEQMARVAWDTTVSPKGDWGAQIDDVGQAQESC